MLARPLRLATTLAAVALLPGCYSDVNEAQEGDSVGAYTPGASMGPAPSPTQGGDTAAGAQVRQGQPVDTTGGAGGGSGAGGGATGGARGGGAAGGTTGGTRDTTKTRPPAR